MVIRKKMGCWVIRCLWLATVGSSQIVHAEENSLRANLSLGYQYVDKGIVLLDDDISPGLKIEATHASGIFGSLAVQKIDFRGLFNPGRSEEWQTIANLGYAWRVAPRWVISASHAWYYYSSDDETLAIDSEPVLIAPEIPTDPIKLFFASFYGLSFEPTLEEPEDDNGHDYRAWQASIHYDQTVSLIVGQTEHLWDFDIKQTAVSLVYLYPVTDRLVIELEAGQAHYESLETINFEFYRLTLGYLFGAASLTLDYQYSSSGADHIYRLDRTGDSVSAKASYHF